MAEQLLRRDPSLPRSIGIWGDEPRKVALPEEPFGPAGAWSQLYSVYILGPFDKTWRFAFRSAGALRLERAPAADGRFIQTGRRLTQMVGGTWLSTEWTAECDGDRLATPRRWSFTSDLLFEGRPVDTAFRYPDVGPDAYRDRPLPMASAKHEIAGRLEADAVLNEGCGRIPLAPGTAVCSNWGLFDAVQRLAPDLAEALRFDMIEDFDLHKPGQVLRRGGALTVEFAGGPVRLHGFRQTGWGVLPWEYWVNEQGRLVLAVGGYRGYILNPNEPIGEKLV